jgi:outer membrane protein OmpA-like peptidoglycan-associated protein
MLAVALIGSGALAACSTSPSPNAEIERARAEVVAAVNDPLVGRYARGELESAQDAFAQAERDRRRRSDPQVISHWAYLAGQRAATAREAAKLRHAEEQIQLAEAERQQKLAEARRIEGEPLVPMSSTGSGAPETAAARVAASDVVVVFADDQFQPGGAGLDPRASSGIDRIANLLRDDPQRVVRLESHVDDMGSRSRSIEQSGRRAEAVRAALVARGVEARRIVVRALGDSYPVASNETSLGRERNRRVEAVISTTPRSGAL